MGLFFYFTLALIVLITVHEFGHFIVARLLGVKVLRFSFGFGKVLARWHDKKGTEYAWSLFPLGGYVKMLDEGEGPVPENERHLAFNTQSVWTRIAIVLAGPLFNFIFAFFALWLALMIGMKSLAPIINQVKTGSVASQAGIKPNHEIIAFNDKEVSSWHDFQYTLMPLLGTYDSVPVTLKSLQDNTVSTKWLPMANWQLDPQNPDILQSLGITPFIPSISPLVGDVVKNTPAEAMGLQYDDKIFAVNNKVISDWLELVTFVKNHPGEAIILKVQRQGKILSLTGKVGSTVQDGKKEGFLGVKSQKVNWPPHWLREHREGFLQAGSSAFKKTVELSTATIKLIGRLVTGALPLQTISGPVGIAQGAGESGRSGLPYYLYFLALVSISLGVLNILPIPMLDGGHLLYFVIEIIRRKPLSEGVKSAGVYLGLVVLLALMVLGLSNDLARLGN